MNKQTALFSWHNAHSAKMSEFAGWDMPLYYEKGAKYEHLLVRHSCGLFDVSHMGRFLVRCTGDEAVDEFEMLLSSPVANLAVGVGAYGFLCQRDGGVVDDVYNFRLSNDTYLLVVNAANRQKDYDWIHAHCPNVQLDDVTDTIGMIAVQGPRSFELLEQSGFGEQTRDLSERNTISAGDVFTEGIFTRTGYTGENGVEVYAPHDKILRIWNCLLEQGKNHGIECSAIGLAARDSLRFESGYALYGHELSEEITPAEAGLKWACKLKSEDPDFLGRVAIQNSERRYRIRSLKMIEPAMPRKGMTVYDDGAEIGWVCSGMACPTLNGFYANVYLKNTSQIADRVYIDVRGKRKIGELVKRPLYSIL